MAQIYVQGESRVDPQNCSLAQNARTSYLKYTTESIKWLRVDVELYRPTTPLYITSRFVIINLLRYAVL